MERDTTVEALFQDLMNNGSMDEPWTVRPDKVVKPVLCEFKGIKCLYNVK